MSERIRRLYNPTPREAYAHAEKIARLLARTDQEQALAQSAATSRPEALAGESEAS